MLPYHKPPPYERPNWVHLNEGQRRYAMEQYNLAIVRRGGRIDHGLNEPEEAPRSPVNDQDFENALNDLLGHQDNQEAEEVREETNNQNMSGIETVPASSSMDVESSVSGKHSAPGKGKGPGGKRARTEPNSISQLPGTSGNTDGMTGSGSGVPEASMIIQNISRGIPNLDHTFVFRKKWKFLSFGIADTIIKETVETDVNRLALTTSLANIPWEYMFMYMSVAEFKRLKTGYKGVFAHSCRIKIGQYNPRVAFQTADTSSTTATLNQNKFTRIGIGLRQNAALTCSDRDYVYNNTEPMLPDSFGTSLPPQLRMNLRDAMYGKNNVSASFADGIPAYVTGQELGLEQYLTMYAPSDVNIGFVPYNQFCDEYNAMDLVGKCVVDQEYTFKYAPLVPRWGSYMNKAILGKKATDTATVFAEGTDRQTLYTKTNTIDTNQGPFTESQRTTKLFNTNTTITLPDTFRLDDQHYRYSMERGAAIHELNHKNTIDANQPSIHVGVRAVPKLSTNANQIQATSWLDTQMYWTVDCELVVKATDPFIYSLGHTSGCIDIPTHEQVYVGNGATTQDLFQSNDLPYVYGKRQMIFQ